EMIMDLVRDTVVFPTQTKVPGPTITHFVVVLNKGIKRVHAESTVDGNLRLHCRGRRSGEKCGQRRKCDQTARTAVEVIVPKPSELAAELHRMLSMNPRQSIRKLISSVATSLRKVINSPKSHHAGNIKVWEN